MEKNSSNKTTRLVLCALFAALVAVGAFIKIPIPYIPLTLQTLFVALAGILLGGRFGAVSVLVYLAIGLAGLPVFTQGGGLMYVLKPTFGYLIGFVAEAYITGTIVHKTETPSFMRLLAASLLGIAVLYLFGMVYYFMISHLYLGTNITIRNLFLYCFLATIPGDFLSCAAASVIGKRLCPITRKYVL